MEEIQFILAKRGNEIHVINKGFGSELGIIHFSGNKYQYEDKEYSHLNNAVETLVNNQEKYLA